MLLCHPYSSSPYEAQATTRAQAPCGAKCRPLSCLSGFLRAQGLFPRSQGRGSEKQMNVSRHLDEGRQLIEWGD